MDIDAALYLIGAKLRLSNDYLPASKDNQHMVYLDGGYATAVDIRELGTAYITIADHLDKLNKELQ